MKKIFIMFLSIILLISFQLTGSAEIYIENIDFGGLFSDIEDMLGSTGADINSDTDSRSCFADTQNLSVTFYVSNDGTAEITYSAMLKNSDMQSGTVTVKLYRRIWGVLWESVEFDNGEALWLKSFSGRYSVNSLSTHFEKDGLYRAKVTLSTGKDNFSTTVQFYYEKGMLMGDVNGDSRVTASDARAALRAAANVQSLNSAQTSRADIDHDGKVKSADARIILKLSALRR